jgi:hypothetical protein
MITIHAGQCGNQLGYCVMNSIFSHLNQNEELMGSYFRQSSHRLPLWTARSVCLDTEPKVIHECIERSKQSKRWTLDERSSQYRHGGAGNNWAMGYQMFSADFRDESINCIRRELEHADFCTTLATIHSVGGGTGSGLGTRITEEISDEVLSITLTVMLTVLDSFLIQHLLT